MDHITIGETIYFDFATSRFDTGAVANADTTPTAVVYEDNGTAAMSGTSVAQISANAGEYRVTIVATQANGYEDGKTYNVWASATVNTVAGKACIATFRARAAGYQDISAAGVTAIWGATSRTLSSFGTLVADIWTYATRTLTSFGTLVADTADAVWDEILSPSSHNTVHSAGRKLRQLSTQMILEGTAVSATSNTIVLDSDASSTNGAYDPAGIYIVTGTGAGQCRNILQYNGSTRTAVVDRDWRVNPSTDSVYIIYGDAGREHVNEGLAQGGGSSTITLNANASSQDDAYNGQRIFIRSGTGADQARRIADYDGASRLATTTRPWSIVPDTTSAYVMLPTSALTDACIAKAVLRGDLAEADTAGEFAYELFLQMAKDATVAKDATTARDATVAKEATMLAQFAAIGAPTTAQDLPRGQAQLFPFKMVDIAGNGVAGLSVTVTLNRDGAGYVAATNVVQDWGGGMYAILLTASEMNADAIAFRATAVGAQTRDITLLTDAA